MNTEGHGLTGIDVGRGLRTPPWRASARLASVAILLVLLCVGAATAGAAEPSLDAVWANPPPDARLRAYWWWLNGNVDRAAITRDLEQMKAKGFGGALICDAGGAEQRNNGRVPPGPTFGTPEWIALLAHALAEGERLQLEMSLSIQSGWNLGGPRVPVDDAVKKLVTSEAVVEGGAPVDLVLPAPPRVAGYYRDLFVLAYPLTPGKPASGGVSDWKQRALEEKIKMTGPNAWFLTNSAPRTDVLVRDEPDRPGEEDAAAAQVIDVTSHFSSADGRLRWPAPAGQWQVIRFGCTLGDDHKVSTHSDGWAGYAIDVFDRGAFERYWADAVEPVLTAVKPHLGRSLRFLHTDSWEVDLINWTPTLRDEFRQRRGYDPLPYLPAFAGRIIGSRTETIRFLNDYRRTLGDLAIDNHYVPFRAHAVKHGMGLHPESGGPHYTPIDAQRCLGLNDVPMAEFWASAPAHRTTDEVRFFVKQPASAAHTYGKRFVAAEGFTTIGLHWQETLWDNLKPAFDHAVSEGLNRLVWHAFVCSPDAMGIPGQQYFAGTHLNPNVTWWEYSEPFFTYINRVQALTQRGLFVADALYYYGDHVPNFAQSRASDPAKVGPGFDYDVITEEALVERVQATDGRLVLPDGMSYRVLVLPDRPNLSLPVLRKVRELVAAGATVIGPKPLRAPTLGGQPGTDEEVRRIAEELWGDRSGAIGATSAAGFGDPARQRKHPGRVISDRTAREVLLGDGVMPDVEIKAADPKVAFDCIHRREGDTDIYFIANRARQPASAEVTLRVSGRKPELWDPVTGARRPARAYTIQDGRTTLPLSLPPHGSLFVIFREPAPEAKTVEKPTVDGFEVVAELGGPWALSFDPKWGGPADPVTFEALVSWTDRTEPGIKHYSGTVTYRTRFSIPSDVGGVPSPRTGARDENARGEGTPPTTNSAGGLKPALPRLILELGLVRELAAVRLNGKSLGIVWAPPFSLEATDALRAGENHLEIDVVNFWPNRIIGDAALPPEQRRTKTNILNLKATTRLMPSGLFGPVRLLREVALPVSSNR